MEESVLVAKECGRTDEVRALALGAAQLYREHGAPASALYLLKRAAKILENKVRARGCKGSKSTFKLGTYSIIFGLFCLTYATFF